MATQRRKFKADVVRSIQIAMALANFTDGGGTVGTFDASNIQLPAGSQVLGVKIVGGNFSGDTTASVSVGTSGTATLFSGAAKTGFEAAFPVTAYGAPAAEADAAIAAATPIRCSVTGAADFTSIVTANAGGKLYVEVYYLDLNSKSK